MHRARRSIVAAAAALLPLVAPAAPDPAPGYAPRTDFQPPRPGSYVLQHIQQVGDFPLIDSHGRVLRLRALLRGRITLLTFFYTSCADPLGCPFAFGVIHGIRERARSEPPLHGLQFVSISLDPARDTPPVLARTSENLVASPGHPWHFLTAHGVADLLPVTADFGQDVAVATATPGAPARLIHHMLKMFLIDGGGSVREIYSLDFMQPAVIMNDLRTLALERATASRGRHTLTGAGR
jgi:cytochrome oxidase Cu insertion factor (SCO1/SenC/PrrC family)